MAKKKTAKKKTSKKSVKKKSSRKSASKVTKTRGSRTWWGFVNLLIFVVFLYGIYHAWNIDSYEGLSIIAADLLAILIIKLYLNLRKK